MRINPVYKKELKTGVRTIKMSLIILAYNGILAFIGLLAFFLCFSSLNGRIDYSNILAIYTFIACLEFGLILFVVPALTSSAISGERERQTLEILLTTTLKPIQVITGKLCASISQIVLLVLSSLPVLSIVFSIGGIRFQDLFMLMVISVATAIFVGSIGVFYSTVFKKTVPATVFTYGTLIILVLATIIGIFVAQQLLETFYDRQFYGPNAVANAIYNPPRVGNTALVLLLNPAVTMFSMLNNQFGGSNALQEFLNGFGVNHTFIINYWFQISIGVQLLLSVLLLAFSAKALNPIKKAKKTKKKN